MLDIPRRAPDRAAYLDNEIALLIGRQNYLYDQAVAKAEAQWEAHWASHARVIKTFDLVTSLHPKAANIEQQAKRVHAIADREAKRFRRDFYRVVARARTGVDEEALERAVEAGNIYAILGAFPPLRTVQKAALDITNDDLGHALYLAYLDTANEFGTSQLSFDLINPYAVQYAATRSDFMFSTLSHEQAIQVRDVLQRAVDGQYDPHTAAILLRDMIGLGPQGTGAVQNYRLGLERRVADGQTLAQAARAEGSDRALAYLGLNGANSIDALTERYADRWVAYRADMIARTETMRAANMGNLESWKIAAQQGLIDPGASNLVWYTAEDDGVCDECDDLDQQVVGFSSGDLFGATEDTPGVEAPPIHPNCRCIITLDAEMPQEPQPMPATEEDATTTEPGFADAMMDAAGSLPDMTPEQLADAIEQPFGEKRPYARDLWTAMRESDDPMAVLDAIHAAASDYGTLADIKAMVPKGTPVRQQAVERISKMAQELSDQTLRARFFGDTFEVFAREVPQEGTIVAVQSTPSSLYAFPYEVQRGQVLTDAQGLFSLPTTELRVDALALRGEGEVVPVITPVIEPPTIPLGEVVGPLGQAPADEEVAAFYRDINAMLEDVGPRAGWFDRTDVRWDGLPEKRALDQLDKVKNLGARIDEEVRRRASAYNSYITPSGRMGMDSPKYLADAERLRAEWQPQIDAAWHERQDFINNWIGNYMRENGVDRIDAGHAWFEVRDTLPQFRELDARSKELMDARDAAFKPYRNVAMNANNDYAAEFRNVMSEIREMGTPGDIFDTADFIRNNVTSDERFVDRFSTALQNYPRAWIDAVLDNPQRLNVQSLEGRSDRAFYTGTYNRISLSPRDPDSRYSWSTAVHEFGHAVENAIEEIKHAEWAYYWQRTTPVVKGTGELQDAKRVFKLGRGYRPEEVYRKGRNKDFNWFNNYMGKANYGVHYNSAYELLTMGMEGVTAGDSLGFIGSDPDMVAFILGLVAAA